AKIVVTCDCGTASIDEIAECEAAGVPVIVTDHHEPGPVLPKASALLNPKRPGEAFPDKNLCGTGVAFFLVLALRRALREIGWFSTHQEPNLKSWLDVVAIATIGDVVPLVGANRVFVREGLPLLAAGSRLGIEALKEVAISRDHFDETSVSFALVPRINAAGRLGSARAALDLLLTADRQEARRLASALDGENRKRQEIEAGMLEEALASVAADPTVATAPAIVLASERFHMGVVGIIAARLVDRFHRPSAVLAIAEDEKGRFGRGSARGIRKANLYDILCGCAEHLVAFGGHAMAAGMTVSAEKIPAFRAAFLAETAKRLTLDDYVPEVQVDAVLGAESVSEHLVGELTALGPHGMSNPEPVLVLKNARVAGSRIVGGSHLRLDLRGSPGVLEAIGFGYADALSHLPESLDVAVVPRMREWNGRVRAEFRIKDLGLGAVEKLGPLAD
ncbi:MAG TPA: DHHA1 domain-containing protein, partial [bacterium]|nr:DHHA1 domain-containing protein [bacterium]